MFFSFKQFYQFIISEKFFVVDFCSIHFRVAQFVFFCIVNVAKPTSPLCNGLIYNSIELLGFSGTFGLEVKTTIGKAKVLGSKMARTCFSHLKIIRLIKTIGLSFVLLF